MNNEVILFGQLDPDGTLRLDHAPLLPSGPVEVVIRSLPAAASAEEGWWEALERIHAKRVAAGAPMRTKEEIDREIDEGREDRDVSW